MLSNLHEDCFNPTPRSSKSEAASDTNTGPASSSSSAHSSSSALVTASLSSSPATNSPLPVDIQNVVFDYLLMAEPPAKSPAVLTSAKEEASSSQSSSAVTEAAAAATAVTPVWVPSLDDENDRDEDEDNHAAASTSTMNTHLTTSTAVRIAVSAAAAITAGCSAAANDTKHMPNTTPVSCVSPEKVPSPDFDKKGMQCGRYATGLNTPGLSFFDTASLAVAAHNLLWRKEVDKTLAFLKNNPELLFKVVEIEDPYGQKVRGTILQIVAAAGDRNPRALKADEKPCGVVEKLYECFPNEQKHKYTEQLNDWFNQYNLNLMSAKKTYGPLKKDTVYIKADQYHLNYLCISPKGERVEDIITAEELKQEIPESLSSLDPECLAKLKSKILAITSKRNHTTRPRPDSKEATQMRMEPYVRAMETLCKELIEDKDHQIAIATPTTPFADLLKSPAAEKFRRALNTPDPNVVTSGLIFDYQLFLKFFEIWERNIDGADAAGARSLGPYYSLKSDLFATIVYLALLKRTPHCDWGTFKKGLAQVVDGDLPHDVDFSKGIPSEFAGFGDSFFFGLYGNIFWAHWRQGPSAVFEPRRRFFKAYVEQKHQLWNYATPRAASSCHESATEPMPRNVTLGSRAAANAASP